jgi:polyphosphate kinase
MNDINLSNPELYINRELSLLEFNRRVIEQAKDENVPLLERLRFLCIAGTNLDEFFEIRVAGLKQQVNYGSVQTGSDNLSAQDVLSRVSEIAHVLVSEQYDVLNSLILPALAREKIRLIKREDWKPALARWVKRYFNAEVLPVLSPGGPLFKRHDHYRALYRFLLKIPMDLIILSCCRQSFMHT